MRSTNAQNKPLALPHAEGPIQCDPLIIPHSLSFDDPNYFHIRALVEMRIAVIGFSGVTNLL